MKWAAALLAAIALSPAFAGLKSWFVLCPGACAPGFMLPPASQATTILFVQSQADPLRAFRIKPEARFGQVVFWIRTASLTCAHVSA